MRLRIERKLLKRLRTAQHDKRTFVQTVQRHQHTGLSLGDALRAIVGDPRAGWLTRVEAGRLLQVANPGLATEDLLEQFFSLERKKDELWEIALTLEHLRDRHAVAPLISALKDLNQGRRKAAARALGWISKPGIRAVDALIDALSDPSQPPAVREEAAESLAYLHSSRAIPPLISGLSDSDVRIRFWAVFALGSIRNRRTFCHSDRRVVPALERMLTDHAIPPGDFWSISREALSMLAGLDPPEAPYADQLNDEINRVIADPKSTAADRRWAEFYNRDRRN